MKDNKYVVTLETFICHNGHVVLVMPLIEHDVFNDYFSILTITEVQQYMKSLFKSLEAVHSYHIIHRDIKPSNFLYCRKDKTFKLVDFGLAQLCNPCKGSQTSQPVVSQILPVKLCFNLTKSKRDAFN